MLRLLLPVLSLFLLSCQSANVSSAGQAIYPSLDPLVNRVMAYREVQQGALEQFQAARQPLSALLNYESGELRPIYFQAFNDYAAALETTVAVGIAIAAVDQEASTLFQEWQVEVEVLTDARLKADNQTRLGQILQGYEGMMDDMRASEADMESAMAAMKSNVSFFKYNLNASGVSSRKAELEAALTKIESLLQAMKVALASSGAFVESAK